MSSAMSTARATAELQNEATVNGNFCETGLGSAQVTYSMRFIKFETAWVSMSAQRSTVYGAICSRGWEGRAVNFKQVSASSKIASSLFECDNAPLATRGHCNAGARQIEP